MIESNKIIFDFRYWFIKRAFDILFSCIAVIILSPIFLLISILILLFNGYPIFYKWNVHGLKGSRFTSYKFRTMIKDADSLKSDLERSNEMSGVVFKMKDDPRITKFGKLLRKYSLDELPQFFSVIKGDMSVIGPRPSFPHEFEKFQEWQYRKFSVVPGLSCLWQVSGRNKINDFNDWTNLDLYYIDNWSLMLDIKIFVKTILTVIRGSGT